MPVLHPQFPAARAPEIPNDAGEAAPPGENRIETRCHRDYLDPPAGDYRDSRDSPGAVHRYRRCAERAPGDPGNATGEDDRDDLAYTGRPGPGRQPDRAGAERP